MSSHELRGESRTAPQWQGALPARTLQGLYCVLVWWPQRHPQPVQNGRLALKGLLELKKKGRRVGAECEQDLGIGRNPQAKVRAGWGKSVSQQNPPPSVANQQPRAVVLVGSGGAALPGMDLILSIPLQSGCYGHPTSLMRKVRLRG